MPTVAYSLGYRHSKNVKNLSWLIKHLSISYLNRGWELIKAQVIPIYTPNFNVSTGKAELLVTFALHGHGILGDVTDTVIYTCTFESYDICIDWISKRIPDDKLEIN